MSTPTNEAPALPEDCAACDEHEEVYPIGGSCPECGLVEVRELAQRWARNVAHGGGVDGLNGVERYRLFTWVREQEYTPHAMGHAGWLMERLDLDYASAKALCEAAGWPS